MDAHQGQAADIEQAAGIDWSWPPYHPEDPAAPRFRLEEWAPPSVVRRPWVRVGRWTLLYRRP